MEKLKQKVKFFKKNFDFTVFWERLFAVSLFAIFGYCFLDEILPQISPRFAIRDILYIVILGYWISRGSD